MHTGTHLSQHAPLLSSCFEVVRYVFCVYCASVGQTILRVTFTDRKSESTERRTNIVNSNENLEERADPSRPAAVCLSRHTNQIKQI